MFMYLVKIYFILGLAMALVALWDYRMLTQTAKRFTKQQQKNGSKFSRMTVEVRNMVVMFLFALFLWPMVVYMETFKKGEG